MDKQSSTNINDSWTLQSFHSNILMLENDLQTTTIHFLIHYFCIYIIVPQFWILIFTKFTKGLVNILELLCVWSGIATLGTSCKACFSSAHSIHTDIFHATLSAATQNSSSSWFGSKNKFYSVQVVVLLAVGVFFFVHVRIANHNI